MELAPVHIAADCLVLFVAGAVRGFSGFGFAMVAVTGLSLLRSPAEVVPAVLVLELVASLQLLPKAWPHIHWQSFRRLVLGAALGTLPGASLLALAPAAVMRLWVSAIVCGAAWMLARGWTLKRRPGSIATFATGALAGLLNSSAAIGGPPVIVYYLGSALAPEVSRASLIAFFSVVDVFSLFAAHAAGLFHRTTVLHGLTWLVPAWAGVVLGEHLFTRRPEPQRYRIVAIGLLALLGLAGLVRAALELGRF